MARPIAGSTAVITGASSGIGRATAIELARRGANVVLAARSAESLNEIAQGCEAVGARALAVPTDVADEAAVEELARRAEERFGGIDTWVNGAAVMAYGTFEQIPPEVFRRVVETNLFGQVHGARAGLPRLRERGGGVLVNISSVWGQVSSPYVSPYVVSKFGVRALTECLQQGLAAEPDASGVRVAAILPESVNTPIFRHAANYGERQVKPVPPVLDPDRVVSAIVAVIERPRARITVGWSGRMIEAVHDLAPWLYREIIPLGMRLGAFRRRPADPGPGNVFAPMPSWNRVRGAWGREQRLSRLGAVTAATAAGALAIGLAARRGGSRRM